MSEQFINEVYRCRNTAIEMLYDRGYNVRKCMRFSREEFGLIMDKLPITTTKGLTAIDLYCSDKQKETAEGVYDLDSKTIEEDGTIDEEVDAIDETKGDDAIEEDGDGLETTGERNDDERVYELNSMPDHLEISDDDSDDEELMMGGGVKKNISDGKSVIVKFIFDDVGYTSVLQLMRTLLGEESQLILIFCGKSYMVRDENGYPTLGAKYLKSQDKYTNCFYYKSLIVNITKHKYVPEHQLITDKREIYDILKMYSIKSVRELPSILVNDPVCKYYNGRPGDIFKIFRYNKNDRNTVVYRGVV